VIELASELKPGSNYLCYGNADSRMPSYDIAHFAEKIPDELTAVTLGAVEDLRAPVVTRSPLLESKRWLWAVIVVMIALLGYFTMKMMKQKSAA
jgi:hypothetical protein